MRRYGVVVLSLVTIILSLLWSRSGDISEPSRREALAARRSSPVPLAVPASEPSPVAATELRIEGTVVDANQHTPISNATLEFESDRGDRTVLTDANGRFAVVDNGGTWLLVSVRAKGYAVANPELVYERPTTGVKVELTRLPERRGRVVDQSGRPIEGALIQPWAEADFAGRELESSLSDPKGEFRLIADAITRVEVSHLCCITKDVPAGPADRELVITLDPARIERVTLKGFVVDEDGQPVEGAKVSGIAFAREPEVAQSIEVTSGAGGRFSVEIPAKAKVDLVAELGESGSDESSFEAQDEAKLVLLERAGSFAGRVTDETGAPITRFTVAVRGAGTWNEREFATVDGRYLYTGLQKLDVTVVLVTALDHLHGEPRALVLKRGQQLTGMDFVLQRGRRVSGVVIDEQSRAPLAWANVRLANGFSITKVANGRARTDALGRFTLKGLTPVREEIIVSRSGYRSHQLVIDTTSETELRIGLVSSSSPNQDSDYIGLGMKFRDHDLPDAGSGYFVFALSEEGGARVAGIQTGDEILAAEGVIAGTVSTDEFGRAIKGAEGTLVTLTVRRDGRTFDVHAVRRRLTPW